MAIHLSNDAREEATESLRRYAEEYLEITLGSLQTSALLDYVLDEIGPAIYNQALVDVSERIQMRLLELDAELAEPEFTFWDKRSKRR